MSTLYYENLQASHQSLGVMKQTYYHLGQFYKHLDGIKKHLESEEAVSYLKYTSPEKAKKKDSQGKPNKPEESGWWVRLDEIPGSSKDFDASLRLFLDENLDQIYEVDQDEFSSNKNAFDKSNEIEILDRDPENEKLLLDRKPNKDFLAIRPSTYQITRQINAIRQLQNSPVPDLEPLINLCKNKNPADWPSIVRSDDDPPGCDWHILTDENRPGTREQRKFVDVALNTPDFAFLDGPPGSGKTTAICELILQLAKREKRVLLCASTHVAIDNVLERLMDEKNLYRDMIVPVRVGGTRRVSEKAAPWQFKNFIKTERDRLLKLLSAQKKRSQSQEELLNQLNAGHKTLQRMLLDAANLVCGTTIGILQHPDIKNKQDTLNSFDLMIIDEASKTTFQEFLVPALYAKTWVLVGDPKQLSPYVDDQEVAVNFQTCLPETFKQEACYDAFKASETDVRKHISALVCTEDKEQIDFYCNQAKYCGASIATAESDIRECSEADIVIGHADFINSIEDYLPLDTSQIRGEDELNDTIIRQANAYNRTSDKAEVNNWGQEIAWRCIADYGLRQDEKKNEKLAKDIEKLLPYDQSKETKEEIFKVERLSFPSILESLKDGFGKNKGQRDPTSLSDGLPEEALKQRSVALVYQHRMHPEIAAFSHKHIYGEKALHSPENLYEDREWSYMPNRLHVIWQHITSSSSKGNRNDEEVDAIVKELKQFDDWAAKHPCIDSSSGNKKPWEVACLTFYRDQERVLRNALRKWTKNHHGIRCFSRGSSENPHLAIQVCTVDRFQGQEADIVLLSFAKQRPTSFLRSPNRLNVAITRAKFQLIIYGNRGRMQKAPGKLGEFAKFVEGWGRAI